ncbi:MAG: hypothetical protein LBM93_05095 [Oscillospiraceae bacterium]|jgi:hypothetical protein|nr:hypothetical protein [Oscillospiraceae bacterium]
MRGGVYTIYNNFETKVRKIENDNNNVELHTTDPKSLDLGYHIYKVYDNGTVYEKIVPKTEISDCYKINTYAIHKGIDSGILGGKDEKHWDICINIYTNEDVKRAVESGFEMWDRGVYRKKDVPIEELEFYEIKSEYDLWAN